MDRDLRADLNQSDFRYFSRTLDVDFQGEAKLGVGATETEAAVIVKKMQLVMEWGRWRVQTTDSQTTEPFVSGVDVGIGVRIIFDVTLATTDTKFAANFGFGTLATALATNSATILVRYDSVGTTANLLPESSPTTITTVESYVKAVNAFYDAVRNLSRAYEEYVKNPASAKNAAMFDLGALSYHISNLPRAGSTEAYAWTTGYQSAITAIRARTPCTQFVSAAAEAITNQAKRSAFADGALAAYSDVLAVGQCDSSPINEAAEKAAGALQLR